MSEKEKRMMESVAKLPDPLKDRFLDKIEGAVMALDLASPQPKEKEAETGHGP